MSGLGHFLKYNIQSAIIFSYFHFYLNYFYSNPGALGLEQTRKEHGKVIINYSDLIRNSRSATCFSPHILPNFATQWKQN